MPAVAHIVLLKAKPDAPAAELAAMLEVFRAMPSTMSELVLSSTAGENFSPRSKGFTHAATITIKDRDALAAYATHPVHLALIDQYINVYVEDRLVVDYDLAHL